MSKPASQTPPKIHCALCLHCKVFRHTRDGGHTFIKLIRCAKGQWRDEQGSRRTYDHHQALKLTTAHCDYFEGDCDMRSIGEATTDTGEAVKPNARAMLRDIQASLPSRRIVYLNPRTPDSKPC